jgi:large subunit ribosomal protein L23
MVLPRALSQVFFHLQMPPKLQVAQRLWFPNITMKLVRSNLPPHQQALYCPPQLNKFDIKQYLEKLYSVNILDVRTMNYAKRDPKKRSGTKELGGVPQYKKVIVTLDQDFVFPPPPDVKRDDCIRIPPQVTYGKNSARRVRSKIFEQARERGVDLNQKP